jgi:hypothetical protein
VTSGARSARSPDIRSVRIFGSYKDKTTCTKADKWKVILLCSLRCWEHNATATPPGRENPAPQRLSVQVGDEQPFCQRRNEGEAAILYVNMEDNQRVPYICTVSADVIRLLVV